jgi:hypothetical protein
MVQMKFNRWLLAAGLLIPAHIFLRIYYLADLQPQIDQAAHISWVINLLNSTHLLPSDCGSLLQCFAGDNRGFVANLVRPGYQDPGHLLNLFPILILYLVGLFAEIYYLTFNWVSIFFSVLGMFFLARIVFLVMHSFASTEKLFTRNVALIFALLASQMSAFLFIFSPLGIHNFALLFFLWVTHHVIRKSFDEDFHIDLKLIFLTILACYCHKINVMLLIPSISIWLMCAPVSLRSKLSRAVIFNLCIAAALIPVGAFLLINTQSSVQANLAYAGLSSASVNLIIDLPERCLRWVALNLEFTNVFLMALAIYVTMTRTATKGLFFLYAVMAVHFMYSIVLPFFSSYPIRTYLYIAPLFLILGCCSLFAGGTKSPLRGRVWIWFVLGAHTVWEASGVFIPQVLFNRFAGVTAEYYRDSRSNIAYIERQISAQPLIAFDYPMQNLVKAISGKTSIYINSATPPIHTLIQWQKSGELDRMWALRRPLITLPAHGGIIGFFEQVDVSDLGTLFADAAFRRASGQLCIVQHEGIERYATSYGGQDAMTLVPINCTIHTNEMPG